MWEMPGGKREPGDRDNRSTVKRELLEEIGVEAAVGDKISTARLDVEVDLRVILYEARVVSGTPRPVMHDDLRWVDLSYAIVSMPCAPATYQHYRACMESLTIRAIEDRARSKSSPDARRGVVGVGKSAPGSVR